MSELIDREAVREFIKSYRNSTDVAFHMEDHLDEIPTASPWHRVDEPPKERNDYFAFTSDGEAKVCDYIPSVKQWWDGDYMILNVTHWMPIEPPKEDA